MIDIIIAFLAAEGLPALALLCRVRQTGLSGDAGVVAALQSLGRGSALLGLGCLLLMQLLAIALVMGGFLLYFHWKYRKAYDSPAAAGEAAEGVVNLPVSALMKDMVFRHIGMEFARRLHARIAKMRKQNGQQ